MPPFSVDIDGDRRPRQRARQVPRIACVVFAALVSLPAALPGAWAAVDEPPGAVGGVEGKDGERGDAEVGRPEEGAGEEVGGVEGEAGKAEGEGAEEGGEKKEDGEQEGGAEAEEEEGAEAEEEAPLRETLEETLSAAQKGMEATHARLQQGILDRVVWFDDFFGSVTTETRRPDYLLRWRNSLRWDEGGHFAYRTSVAGSIRVPKISKRFRLFISGENEAEPVARHPEDPGNPGFDTTLPNTRVVNTEVRYTAVQKPDVDLYLGAGVRVRWPLELFVRSRFQYTRRLGSVALLRFAETLFWRDIDGFGETTEVTLERQLGRTTLLRWSNSGTYSEISRGLEWGTSVELLRELSRNSAVNLAAGVFGDTEAPGVVEAFRLASRYRRNLLWEWLFVELEPEVAWPRQAGGAYLSAFAVTFRLEMVFQGSAARKEDGG